LDFGVFEACKGLQQAQVDGTDLVMLGTFDGCTNLQGVQLGNGVVALSRPFSGCLSLRSLEVGTGVAVVSTNACSGLGRLETAMFRGEIEAIEASAFSACSNLVLLSLGGAPKVIGSGAFSRCQQLQNGIDLSQCTNVEGWAFYNCTNLFSGKLALPKIQTVGANAFEYCRKLEQIEFSNQLVSLGQYSFEDCASLSNVWFEGGVPNVGTRPFYQVARGARGHYTAAHREAWEAAIGSGETWQGLIMREAKPKGCRVRLHRNGWKETLEEDDLVSRWIDFGEKLPEKPFERGDCTFYGWSVGSPDFEWGVGLPGMGLIEDGAVWNPTDEEWDAWREKGWLVQEEDGTYCLDLYGVWGTKTKVVFYNLGGGGGEWLAPDGLKNHVQGQIDETAPFLRNGESVELQPGAHSLTVSVGGEAAPYVATWSARTDPEVEWATTGNAETLACNPEDKFFFRIPGQYKYEGVLAGGEDPSANLTLYVRLLPPGEKGGMVKFDCQWKLSEVQMAEFAAFPSFEAIKVKLRIRRMKTETEPEGGWIDVWPGETSLLAAGTYQLEVGYAEKYWNLNQEATALPSDGQNGNIVRVTVEDGDDKEFPLFFSPFGDGEGLYYRVLFDGNEGTASEKEWWYRHTSGGPFGWTSGGLQGMPKAVREDGWMFAGWFTSSTGGSVVSYAVLTHWMETAPAYRILHAQWKPLDPEYVAWAEKMGMTDAELPTDMDTDEDGFTNWEEYVVGTSPLKKDDRLEIRMKQVNGKLVPEPTAAVPSTGREIHVHGKKSMTDGKWEDVTKVEDKDAEGWRFFRVGVKMAE
jgi:hypothetical protein